VVSLPEGTAADLGDLGLAGMILLLAAGLWRWLGRPKLKAGGEPN
jgi:hypothetical protein